jgi:hypothetical protein
MSRQPSVQTHEQPSCMKENLLSVWIWMRETVDVEIRNRTTAMIAENNLVSVRDNIEKNKSKIVCEQDITMNELRTKARMCRGGTKEQRTVKLKKLLPLLQRFKKYRQQTQLASQQLNLLDVQINAFENGRFQKEMTETLRAGVVAMRKVGISDDASDMDTIVLDMEDTISQQNQLADSMSVGLVNSMDDNNSDEGLMRELMALAGDDDDADDLLEIPVKPSTPTPTQPLNQVEQVVPVPTVLLPPQSVSVTAPMMPVSTMMSASTEPDESPLHTENDHDAPFENVELLS